MGISSKKNRIDNSSPSGSNSYITTDSTSSTTSDVLIGTKMQFWGLKK